jgi:riboflavin kinase/FMN adenylyltransferase
MDIFHHIEEIPADYGPAVVSVGNFDGVHRAHRYLIDSMVARARELHARAVAVTFEPHPTRILQPDSGFKLLTPTPTKLRLLAGTGLDAVLLLPFSRDLSLISHGDFVQKILVEGLHAREVHEGFNFRFGHRAQGHVELLQELGPKFGFEVHVYPSMRLYGEIVSSSRIRELLKQGAMNRARQLLGRPFSIAHTPGRGRGYGSKYTVPTINLSRYDEIVPEDGVYVTQTRVADECFESVTNVGNRPTFGDDLFAIETHLMNFHPLELTSETRVEIAFLHTLRPEIKFPSVDALRQQIALDVLRARRYFHLLGANSVKANRRGAKTPE